MTGNRDKSGLTGGGKTSLAAATALVIGNMVGTGVFTSLGFQVLGVEGGFPLMMLWVLGGVYALAGALCYAELASCFPRSGGEYNLLGRVYHPVFGFLSGWLSAVVGFAAPVALAAMAFGEYVSSAFPGLGACRLPGYALPPRLWLSIALVSLATLAHLRSARLGSRLQLVLTAGKILLIACLIGAAFVLGSPQPVRFLPRPEDLGVLVSGPFAISLFFVTYAYSGWNASTYIAGEVRNPRRNVPLSLILGTLVVLVLYVGLNAAFLYSTPVDKMAGQLEVGLIAATAIFGEGGGKVMGLLIAFGLMSTVSAMTWAGPRVACVMGEDYPLLKFWSWKSRQGVPWTAVLWQYAVVVILLAASAFQTVLFYIEFLLVLSSFLVVLGVIVLRVRKPRLERPFRVPFYPVPPLVFLAIAVFMLGWIVVKKPAPTLWGAATLLAGLGVYFAGRRGKE